MVLRRLPVLDPPAPDEAFASWLHRNAHVLNLSFTEMCVALGLSSGSQQFVKNLGVGLTHSQLENLYESTGLRDFTPHLLMRFDGGVVDGAARERYRDAQSWARANWVSVRGSSACPECLLDSDGVWSIFWKLPWTFGCLRHDRYTLATCPKCGHRWQSEPKDALQRHRCRASLGNGRCDTPAYACEAPPISDAGTRHLLEAISVLTAAEPSETLRATFEDLITLTKFVLYVAPVGSLPQGVDGSISERFARHVRERNAPGLRKGGAADLGYRAYRHTPSDSMLMAAALHLALPIVIEDGSQALEHASALLARVRADSMSNALWHKLRSHWRPSPGLQATFAQAQSRVIYRGGGAYDGRIRSLRPKSHVAVGVENLPQLMWPEIQQRLEDSAPVLGGGWGLSARRFTVLALARTLRADLSTWEAAAESLDMRTEYADIGRRMRHRLKVSGQAESFNIALGAVLDDLATLRDLPNYQQRRAVLADFKIIPPDDWAALLERSGIRQQTNSWRWPAHGATWVWELVTSGDYHDAPALSHLEHAPQQVRETELRSYRDAFKPGQVSRLGPWLNQYAEKVLACHLLQGSPRPFLQGAH